MQNCFTPSTSYGIMWWGGVAVFCAALLLMAWQHRYVVKHPPLFWVFIVGLLLFSVVSVVMLAYKQAGG